MRDNDFGVDRQHDDGSKAMHYTQLHMPLALALALCNHDKIHTKNKQTLNKHMCVLAEGLCAVYKDISREFNNLHGPVLVLISTATNRKRVRMNKSIPWGVGMFACIRL